MSNQVQEVKTFEQIIAEAKTVIDARTKASKELKAAAPTFIQKFAETAFALGYRSPNFEVKLYANQSTPTVNGEYDRACTMLKISKDESGDIKGVFHEARGWDFEDGFIDFIEFDTDYKFDFYGLLSFLPMLPKRIETYTKQEAQRVELANKILAEVI